MWVSLVAPVRVTYNYEERKQKKKKRVRKWKKRGGTNERRNSLKNSIKKQGTQMCNKGAPRH